jgi:quercetin dioxygenase-like cupin family protein
LRADNNSVRRSTEGGDSMNRKPLIVRADDCEPLSVLGTQVTVIASNLQTGGSGFTLQRGAEGTGPPPHCHPWDEAFYVLDGAIDFVVDGTTTRVEAGTLVHVPKGTTHAFSYGPGGASLLEVTGPDSTAAELFNQLAAEMPGDVNVEQVVTIFGRHGAKLMI